MNHNSPIRNDKLLREAYESGRRDALIEQGLEVPAGGMQAVQSVPGPQDPISPDRIRELIRNDRNFKPGGGRAPYFPYHKFKNVGGMRWDGKKWIVYDRQGRMLFYYYPGDPNNPPGWFTPSGWEVWPNPETPSGTQA